MAKRPNLRKKDDVIESIESSTPSGKKPNLGKKKDPKQSLTDSIEQRVKEAVVKIEAHRRNARIDNIISQGVGGGDDLDFFTDDISNGYEYSKKDSKDDKKLPTTDFVLRPVSELDTYKSKDK